MRDKRKWLLLTIGGIVLALCPTLVWAAGTRLEKPSAEAIALLVAGLIAPFIAQLIKALGGYEDLRAMWAVIAVSAVLAAIALLATGEVPYEGPPLAPLEFFAWFAARAGTVLGLATIVYKFFMAPKTRIVFRPS